jgi:hypothetical protein
MRSRFGEVQPASQANLERPYVQYRDTRRAEGETDRVCIRLLLAPCFPERPMLPYPMCNQRASDTMQTLFTLGYQGHIIVTFLDVLQAHGITAVLNVRERPYSRKPFPNGVSCAENIVVVIEEHHPNYLDAVRAGLKLRQDHLAKLVASGMT